MHVYIYLAMFMINNNDTFNVTVKRKQCPTLKKLSHVGVKVRPTCHYFIRSTVT